MKIGNIGNIDNIDIIGIIIVDLLAANRQSKNLLQCTCCTRTRDKRALRFAVEHCAVQSFLAYDRQSAKHARKQRGHQPDGGAYGSLPYTDDTPRPVAGKRRTEWWLRRGHVAVAAKHSPSTRAPLR